MKVTISVTLFAVVTTAALFASRRAVAQGAAPQFSGCGQPYVLTSSDAADDFSVWVVCTRIAPAGFVSPACTAPRNGGCFDAVLSIGPNPDLSASTTPALVDGAGAAASADPTQPTIDLRQDHACTIAGGGPEPLKCKFSRNSLVSAAGASLPAGASIAPGSKVVLRIVGPHCGNGPCTGRAPPSAAVTVGMLRDLAQTVLGARSIDRIAEIARGAASMRACNGGMASACLEVLMNGRAEDRPMAKAQLRSWIATTGCNANDGNACSELADQIVADNGSVADRDAARTKACNLGSAHGCFVLATAMSGDTSTASAAQPLFAKACTGGEGQACEALAGMYETGSGVPKSANRAKGLHGQACDGGVVEACVKAGQRQKACDLGDETSCNILCRAGNKDACNGAAADVKQNADDTAEKQQAEAALPTLMSKCATDRATIQHWKDTLAAAQRAGNSGQAEQASAKLEELQPVWDQLKIDLENAVRTVTGGYGKRFESLRRQARLQCVGHE